MRIPVRLEWKPNIHHARFCNTNFTMRAETTRIEAQNRCIAGFVALGTPPTLAFA
jgi:hypothetical protein